MQRIVQQIDQGLPCCARKKRGRSQQDTSMQLGRDINAVILVDQTFRHHPARVAQANASEITGTRHQRLVARFTSAPGVDCRRSDRAPVVLQVLHRTAAHQWRDASYKQQHHEEHFLSHRWRATPYRVISRCRGARARCSRCAARLQLSSLTRRVPHDSK